MARRLSITGLLEVVVLLVIPFLIGYSLRSLMLPEAICYAPTEDSPPTNCSYDGARKAWVRDN